VTLKQKKSFFFLLQSDLGDVYAPSRPTPPALFDIIATRFPILLYAVSPVSARPSKATLLPP
jgi:hypothetical protein